MKRRKCLNGLLALIVVFLFLFNNSVALAETLDTPGNNPAETVVTETMDAAAPEEAVTNEVAEAGIEAEAPAAEAEMTEEAPTAESEPVTETLPKDNEPAPEPEVQSVPETPVQEAEPVTKEAEPAPEPAVTEPAPVEDSKAPAVTEPAPVEASKAPAVTEPAPVEAAKAPVKEPAALPEKTVTDTQPLLAAAPMAVPNDHYYTDDYYVSVNAPLKEYSTNTHTQTQVIWIQGGMLYLAVASTHEIDFMTLNGVRGTLVAEHPILASIYLDDVELKIPQLQGNVGDSRWTVYKFDPSVLQMGINDENLVFVDGIGNGHDVGGTLDISIRERNLTVTKKWVGLNPVPVTFEVYGVTNDGTEVYITNITVPTGGSNTISVPIASNLGALYESYKLVELNSGNYDVSIVKISGDPASYDSVFVFEATNRVKTTSYTVNKVWKDIPANYTVPDIQLQLLQNGEKYGDPVTLKSGETSYTWSDLPLTDMAGNTYVYSAEEVVPKDFTSKTNGDTITNTYKTIALRVDKIWQGGPEVKPEIEVQLMQNDTAFGPAVKITYPALSYEWTMLPEVDKDGVKYNYTVVETKAPGDYTSTVDGFTITNVYKVIDVTGTKNWVDVPEGYIKPDIQLQLMQNGEKYGDPVTLTSGTSTYTWKGVPEIDPTGKPYEYTVQEVTDLPDFTESHSGMTVTNTYRTKSVEGNKKWVNVPSGYTIPTTIELQLLQNGKPFGEPVTVTGPDYKAVWDKVPEVDEKGEPYVYTVQEVTTLADFTGTSDGMTAVNTYKTIDIVGVKEWDNVPEGYELPQVQFQLYQGTEKYGDPVWLTPNGTNTWNYTWKNVPEVDKDGNPYEYSVKELTILPDFIKSEEGMTVVNTYLSGSVQGQKVWSGAPDGYVYPSIQLQLNQNGVPFGDPVTLAPGTTTYTWNNVPVNNKDGNPYLYTVTELTELKDFDKVESGLVVTNKYKRYDVKGMKVWEGVPAGYTIPAISLQLYQDGKVYGDPVTLTSGTTEYTWTQVPKTKPDGTDFVYEVKEVTELKDFTKTESGMTVTNRYMVTDVTATKEWVGVPEGYVLKDIVFQLYQDGKVFGDPMTLKAGDTSVMWTGVPKVKPDGTAFEYTVKEVTELPDFEKKEEGLKVTNTYKTTKMTGKKIWMDVPEGYAVPAIELQLMQDGKAFGAPVTLASGTTEYTWENLPMISPENKEYVYTVTEVTELPDFDKTETMMTVINTYKTTDITGMKEWMGVPEGYTVPDIMLQLNQNGKPFGAPVTLASGTTEYKWTGVPKLMPDGTPYEYTVTEVTALPDFEKTEEGLKVTNTYMTTSAKGMKVWDKVPEGYMIPDIQLQLMQNGVKFGEPVTLVSGTTEYEWKNLPKVDKDGKEYVYSVEEITALPDFEVKAEGMTVTNTYKTTDVTATKEWMNVPEGYMLSDIEFQLMQNGIPYGDPMVLKAGAMEVMWEDVPLLDKMGKEFIYTVKEITELPDFDKKEEGMKVTNTYKTTSVTGMKMWEMVPEGYMLKDIELQLNQNGKPFGDPMKLMAGEKEIKWENLPMYDKEGKLYNYTVTEVTELPDFTKTENGLNVTNTYRTINVTGKKIWVGGPEKKPVIELQLMRNGEPFGDKVALDGVTEYEWKDVPEVDETGKPYEYTVVEVTMLKDYDSMATGMVVTNTYKITEITAKKIWANMPDNYDIPEIEFQLMQDGKPFMDPVKLKPGMLEYTWKDLPKYRADGTEFVYTVMEKAVEGFKTTYSADKLTVTNTYIVPLPNTGDTVNTVLPMFGLGLLGLGLFTVASRKKRER